MNNESRQGTQGFSSAFAPQSRFKPTHITKRTQNTRKAEQEPSSLSDQYRMFLQRVRAEQQAQYITEQQGIALSYLELLLDSHGFIPDLIYQFVQRAVNEKKAKFIQGKRAVYLF